MTRLITLLLAAGATAGCAHTDDPRQDCHVEAGYLDSTNGCSEREGYPDCYKVCADGTRTKLGSTSQPAGSAASH
jgi:hypothetical protein